MVLFLHQQLLQYQRIAYPVKERKHGMICKMGSLFQCPFDHAVSIMLLFAVNYKYSVPSLDEWFCKPSFQLQVHPLRTTLCLRLWYQWYQFSCGIRPDSQIGGN